MLGSCTSKELEQGLYHFVFLLCNSVMHLELVPDMTRETYIRCIKHSTCQRGTPTRIISDNSKTFTAAMSKELIRIEADPIVKDYFAQLWVCWSFNVEKAPW